RSYCPHRFGATTPVLPSPSPPTAIGRAVEVVVVVLTVSESSAVLLAVFGSKTVSRPSTVTRKTSSVPVAAGPTVAVTVYTTFDPSGRLSVSLIADPPPFPVAPPVAVLVIPVIVREDDEMSEVTFTPVTSS